MQIISTGLIKNTQTDFSKIKNNISDINIYQNDDGNIYKYEAGNRNTFVEAALLKKSLRKLGYSDCFIVSYYKDEKIPVSQAQKLEGGAEFE